MFTWICSFVLYPRAQGWDVRGIGGLAHRFTVICFHSDLVMSPCCCTKGIHVHTTCSQGLLHKCWNSGAYRGSPIKSPMKFPNALSCPLLNRKQASTRYGRCNLNTTSNNKYLVMIYRRSKTLQSAV